MKKKLLAGLAVGVMMLGMAGVASATTYNPATDFSNTNGNPNGVWSYGSMTPEFTFYLDQHTLSTDRWGTGPNESWIWQNQTSELTDYGVQPGQISLHPQWGNISAALRFTALTDGVYDIDGQFFSGDIAAPEVGIRSGSAWLWQGHDQGVFDLSITLAAGTSIDFVVSTPGFGESNYYNSTPLDLTISTAPVPEPATLLLMGTGLAGLVGARRKKKQ